MTPGAMAESSAFQPGQPRPARTIKKILIATDTWSETNGLTTTLQHTLPIGRQRGYRFEVLHPGLFLCLPSPFYR
jgi:hypothetical protein